MNEELSIQLLDNMKVGDILDVFFGGNKQVSITCTQVCGFKYYLVLGNASPQKLYFEGSSKNDREYCLKKMYLYIISLSEKIYYKPISKVSKY